MQGPGGGGYYPPSTYIQQAGYVQYGSNFQQLKRNPSSKGGKGHASTIMYGGSNINTIGYQHAHHGSGHALTNFQPPPTYSPPSTSYVQHPSVSKYVPPRTACTNSGGAYSGGSIDPPLSRSNASLWRSRLAPHLTEVTPMSRDAGSYHGAQQSIQQSIQKHDRVRLEGRPEDGIVLSVNRGEATAVVRWTSQPKPERPTDWSVQTVNLRRLTRSSERRQGAVVSIQPGPRESESIVSQSVASSSLCLSQIDVAIANAKARQRQGKAIEASSPRVGGPSSPRGGKGGKVSGNTDEAKWSRALTDPWTLSTLSDEFITRQYNRDREVTLNALVDAAKHCMLRTGEKRASRSVDEEAEESEVSLVVERSVVSLVDPLSRARIEIPARGKTCKHVSCFDLRTHVSFWCESKPKKNTKKVAWSCPICHGSAKWNELKIDRLQVEALAAVSSNVRDIYVSPSGEEWSAQPFAEKGKAASGTERAEERSAVQAKTDSKPKLITVISLDSDDEDKTAPVTCKGEDDKSTSSGCEVVKPALEPELDTNQNKALKPPTAQLQAQRNQPEVIDLVSSDDDNDHTAPVSKRQRTAADDFSKDALEKFFADEDMEGFEDFGNDD